MNFEIKDENAHSVGLLCFRLGQGRLAGSLQKDHHEKDARVVPQASLELNLCSADSIASHGRAKAVRIGARIVPAARSTK